MYRLLSANSPAHGAKIQQPGVPLDELIGGSTRLLVVMTAVFSLAIAETNSTWLGSEIIFQDGFEPPGPSHVQQYQIINGSDDAEESPLGVVNVGSSDLELGLQGNTENEIVGLRFNNITIEQLSPIVSAHIQFTVDEASAEETSLLIEGEAIDNAVGFTTSTNNISNRPRTAANAVWLPAPWPIVGQAGPAQQSPELAEIINEIVDRPGWTSGNSLVLLISGIGHRVAHSKDGQPNAAPVLHVSFNDPGTNRRPMVNAGADQLLELPNNTLNLNGSVTDDGLPAGQPLTTVWSHVGGTGEGTPVFGDPLSTDTTVSIGPEVGTYLLRLTANDSQFSSSDDLEISVTSNTGAVGAGTVKIHMKIYSSTHTRIFSDPLTAGEEAEMAGLYHRLTTTSPSFDRHLDWFDGAWEYQNLYAIDDSVMPGDPLWQYVLRDALGNPLYIDFGCPPCPKRAGDFGDPGFRAQWIAEAQAINALGYLGVLIDDIALNRINTSDVNGNKVLPIDVRTGLEMTLGDQQTYMAEFAEQIRAALPSAELTHNAVFGAQPADNIGPGETNAIDRALAAADGIQIETGAPVVEGGFHNFGFETFLAFVDKWHGRGKQFHLFDDDSVDDDDGEMPPINSDELRELRYQLATYFLINNGFDTLSADGDAQKYRVYPSFCDEFCGPDSFSTDYQVDLGDALTGHYQWNGLFRRDFECGMVLVNQPEQATMMAQLGGNFIDLDGNTVTSVTLPAVSGAVLRTTASCP